MNRNRIKLLVTLVLVTLSTTSVWMTSQADARGKSNPGASSHFVAKHPGAGFAGGDPDAGQGATNPPPPSLKQLRQVEGGADSGGGAPVGLVRWTGRIWATLYQKLLR